MEKYDAFDVACYIVNSCIDDQLPISNLQLQKILYYAEAAFLVNDKELFRNEISAWRYGPVVEDVYYYFKINANNPIEEKVQQKLFNALDKKTAQIIDRVVDIKRRYDAFELVRMTHEEQPWIDAIKNKLKYIDKAVMKEYFSSHQNRIFE